MATVIAESKLQHWCGVPGIFGLEAAPVLDLRVGIQ